MFWEYFFDIVWTQCFDAIDFLKYTVYSATSIIDLFILVLLKGIYIKVIKKQFFVIFLSLIMKSKTWILRQKNDQFVRKAKQIGYISRAAFKLEEIEKKFNLIV